MRAAYLLSLSFITRGRMGASQAALILMKNSHFDRTLQYSMYISNFQNLHFSFLEWTGKDRLDINVDLTVAMPCDGIGADVLDSTNQNTFTYGRLREDPEWFELDHLQVTTTNHHTGAKDDLNVEGCAKSFAMFCFDFLR